jgi:NADH-quinone oxidoreductase subunit L
MNPYVLLAIALLPLLAAVLAGLFGRLIGRVGAASLTIGAVAVSFALSLRVAIGLWSGATPPYQAPVYTWLVSDGITLHVGFLIDRLSVLMMTVVTFVSLCVHVYSIGYMEDDDGYQRFFAYISLFTFAMLMLVMSDNFMQLFFGWEGVGVVSYLLIGFWYTRPSAIFASLKAFLVNRVGDFGFVLGIAGILYFTGSLDYKDAFAAAPQIAGQTFEIWQGHPWPALTVICLCLFVGAMGKSAQIPLHVWLPDSMEGPTPISALIHAATMVTAGIYMVARMSPLFEYSDTALAFVLVIGATTALFMGFLGVINNDIKRVIAYSTLSQLGYMTVGLGVSAYSVAMFHLMTHAFFKALLFLAAGSVIIGMHHEQDMRRMGGLAKYMPITAVTCWIGALALTGTPFFSGFYSKDSLIEAVGESHRFGAGYAYFAVLAGVFITALYTFRLLFMTFHGPERFRDAPAHAGHAADAPKADDRAHDRSQDDGSTSHAGHDKTVAHEEADAAHGAHDGLHEAEPHESPAVVTGPLIALAIPSVVIGALTIRPLLYGGYFGDSIVVNPPHDVVAEIGSNFHGWFGFALHGFLSPAFWLAAAGAATAWAFFLRWPALADAAAQYLRPLRTLLENKYYFDKFNDLVIARGTRLLGRLLWKGSDQALIDQGIVDGSAALVGWLAVAGRRLQTGYLYSYAFWMVIGLALLLGGFLVRALGVR